MDLRKVLRGTGAAIITPFKKDLSIDLDALGKLIDFIIRNNTEYIVTLGTTGESPVLSTEEKLEVIEFTYEKVKDRVPVVVGIGGNDTYSLVKELQSFPLEKATAILSTSPYYNKPSQQGLFEHYRLLARESPRPLILYNVPARTGRNMTAATTLRLSKEVPNIAGIKEASGDMHQCMEILRNRPEEFLVVSGDDALALPQLSCGMDGVISVAANSFPKEFSDMVRYCLDNKFPSAKLINDRLIEAYDLMFSENNPAGVKAFLSEMKLIENITRLPLVELSLPLQQEVKKYLNK